MGCHFLCGTIGRNPVGEPLADSGPFRSDLVCRGCLEYVGRNDVSWLFILGGVTDFPTDLCYTSGRCCTQHLQTARVAIRAYNHAP